MNMIDSGLINVFDMDVLYSGWALRRPPLIWTTFTPSSSPLSTLSTPSV